MDIAAVVAVHSHSYSCCKENTHSNHVHYILHKYNGLLRLQLKHKTSVARLGGLLKGYRAMAQPNSEDTWLYRCYGPVLTLLTQQGESASNNTITGQVRQ